MTQTATSAAPAGPAPLGRRRVLVAASQPVRLTATGRTAYQDLLRAREQRLHRLCADWHPDRQPQLAALLTRITHQLAASGEKPGADLDAA